MKSPWRPREGRMDRREFFATMAAWGVSATGACALGGIAAAPSAPLRGCALALVRACVGIARAARGRVGTRRVVCLWNDRLRVSLIGTRGTRALAVLAGFESARTTRPGSAGSSPRIINT